MTDFNIRRKRVGEDGEWEYECVRCERWLEKPKFRGCVQYTDPYGNCLICSSCRAKQTRQTQKENEQESIKHILTLIGFYEYESAEEWYRAKHKKHTGYLPEDLPPYKKKK